MTTSGTDAQKTQLALRLQWVNDLWFSGLIFSVLGAFLASLAKGWVTKSTSCVTSPADASGNASGEDWQSARHRQHRLATMNQLGIPWVVQVLPVSIHISLFLFSAGLFIYLQDDDVGLKVIIFMTIVMMGLLYGAISLTAFFFGFSLDTPLSMIASKVWLLMVASKVPFPHKPHSTHHDSVIKVKALAWLLKTSADKVAVRESVQAIAGLPTSPDVQTELLRQPSIMRTISLGFSEAVQLGDHEVISVYLHAILHLVQPELLPKDQIASFAEPLAKLDVLDRGIFELALLVKIRIQPPHDGDELLYTALPIMEKCSRGSAKERLECFYKKNGEYFSKPKATRFAYIPTAQQPPLSLQFGIDYLTTALATVSPIIRTQYAKHLWELIQHSKQITILHPPIADYSVTERFRNDFINGGGIESLEHLHPVGTDSFWGKTILKIAKDGKNVSSTMACRNSLHTFKSNLRMRKLNS